MDREQFNSGWRSLVIGFGKQQNWERADVYYAAFRGWDGRTWDSVTQRALTCCKFFPSIFELEKLKTEENVAQVRPAQPDGAKCDCGICPGDGWVTIFHPVFLSELATRGGYPKLKTCAIRCEVGGFYRLARWAGDVIAPTLPVPNWGATLRRENDEDDRQVEYAREWLQTNGVGRVSAFDDWNEG